MPDYVPKVGDIIEFEGYIGIIIPHAEHVALDWLTHIHPNHNFRSSHKECDWCVPAEWIRKFKLICNVRDN